MPQGSDGTSERHNAHRRRQAYWAGRRTIQRMRERGTLSPTKHMTIEQLWDQLAVCLWDLEQDLQLSARVAAYGSVLRAQEALWELKARGEQLQLAL